MGIAWAGPFGPNLGLGWAGLSPCSALLLVEKGSNILLVYAQHPGDHHTRGGWAVITGCCMYTPVQRNEKSRKFKSNYYTLRSRDKIIISEKVINNPEGWFQLLFQKWVKKQNGVDVHHTG